MEQKGKGHKTNDQVTRRRHMHEVTIIAFNQSINGHHLETQNEMNELISNAKFKIMDLYLCINKEQSFHIKQNKAFLK